MNNFVSYFKIYDLTKINAPIFDNSTISQCWDNTSAYEAWPTDQICYNKSNQTYYFAYSTQSNHTTYDGDLVYRTSKDLITWSDPVVVDAYSGESTDEVVMNSLMYCQNGDLLIHAKPTVHHHPICIRSFIVVQTMAKIGQKKP